jgi:hypothetical protein
LSIVTLSARRYLGNRWIRIAIGLFLLESVPLGLLALLAIVLPPLAAAFPIGEVLWLVTFWPAVFLLAAGIMQVGEK